MTNKLPTPYELAMIAATMKATPDDALELYQKSVATLDIARGIKDHPDSLLAYSVKRMPLHEAVEAIGIKWRNGKGADTLQNSIAYYNGPDKAKAIMARFRKEGIEPEAIKELKMMHHDRLSDRGRNNRSGAAKPIKT